MELGDKVDVFGCVGVICQMTDEHIYVRGTYYYTGDSTFAESWVFKYTRSQFKNKNKYDCWDLTKEEPLP